MHTELLWIGQNGEVGTSNSRQGSVANLKNSIFYRLKSYVYFIRLLTNGDWDANIDLPFS